jgi:hypothetical protein
LNYVAGWHARRPKLSPPLQIFNARNHTAGHLLDYALDMLDYRLVGGSGYHFPDGAYVDAVIEPPLPKDIDLKVWTPRGEAKHNGGHTTLT